MIVLNNIKNNLYIYEKEEVVTNEEDFMFI